jgi:hypothetical protein
MRAFGEQLRWRDRLFYATVLALVWTVVPTIMADAAPRRYERPGFQYAELVGGKHGCGVFVHEKAEWRPFRELHVACTLKAEAKPEGVLIRYEYPGKGSPRKFGAVIEDRTHGEYGDIPFVRAWLEDGYGYVRVPGPTPEHPNGCYVHVEHVYWNMFRGVREDHL